MAYKPNATACREFADTLIEHSQHMAGLTEDDLRDLADQIITWGYQHGRLMEKRCNEPCGPAEDRLELRIEQKLRELTAAAGCKGVKTSGDPRGATVKLIMHDGYTDSWGRDGFCVPGS